jgi:hypothetical protein
MQFSGSTPVRLFPPPRFCPHPHLPRQGEGVEGPGRRGENRELSGDWRGDAGHGLVADGMSDSGQPHERRDHRWVAVSQLASECGGCGGDPELTVAVARWLTMPDIVLLPVPGLLLPGTARMSLHSNPPG